MSELKKYQINDMGAIIDYTFNILSLTISLYLIHKSRKKESRKKETHLNFIQSLFGSTLTRSQVIMPQKQFYIVKHPKFPSTPTFKSANIAAQAISDCIYMPFAEKIKRLSITASKPDFGKNFFTVGSVGGNEYVAQAFSMWSTLFNLRWTFVAPQEKEKDERVYRYSGGKIYASPTYRLYDNVKEEYLPVETREEWYEGEESKLGVKSGNYPFLVNDYMLITKGPSYKGGNKKLEHVNLGGLHGLGIRAHSYFLNNTDLLSKVSKVIGDEGKNGKYYQILLPVKSIFHDRERLESDPREFGEPMVHIFFT